MTQLTYLSPLSDIRERFNQLFYDTNEPFFPSLLGQSLLSDFTPLYKKVPWMRPLPIEVAETEKSFVIRAEIPGVQPEHLEVEVLGDTVLLKGEIKEEHSEKKENIYKSEFHYGKFQRQIPLPGRVKGDEARAEFVNGVLELKIPKLEVSQRNRIKITPKTP